MSRSRRTCSISSRHIPLPAGCSVSDTPASCPSVLVNEDAAREISDGQALGRVIEDRLGRRAEVVGIVRPLTRAGAAAVTRPSVYYYPDQMPQPLGRDGPATFGLPAKSTPMTSGLMDTIIVSSRYFDALGFVVVTGQALPENLPPCRVAVVNQEAAERYFGGDAVDAAVIDELGRRTAIVGVIQSPLLRASTAPGGADDLPADGAELTTPCINVTIPAGSPARPGPCRG